MYVWELTRSGTNCAISIIHYWWSLIHIQHRIRYIWPSSSFLPLTYFLEMMDRQGTSTNPLFIEQEEDPNNYVTKQHLFGTQRALHQEKEALSDHIDLLTTELQQSELRTRDYFDNKLFTHMEEIDARMSTQMEEFHALLVNRSSMTSSSSRWSHSSRHSSESSSDTSLPRARPHHRQNHEDHQAPQNPFHGNGLPDHLRECERLHHQANDPMEQDKLHDANLNNKKTKMAVPINKNDNAMRNKPNKLSVL